MEHEQIEQVHTEYNPVPLSRKKVKRALIILLCLVIVLAIGAGYFFYKSITATRPDDYSTALSRASKLIDLPKNEEPTYVTVTDPSKLQDQVFFANASVGDIVFVYTKAKKVVLYNPVKNKIIEVAPLDTPSSEGEISTSSEQSSTSTATSTVRLSP